MFHGGLNLSLTVLREVAVSLGLLAIPGVLLTTLLTGAVAALAFGLPFEQGLLIGAVLSPTDPAILIALFVASRVRLRIAQTVIAESAFNDPTGAVLALAIAGALLTGEGGIGGPASEFLAQLAVSSVVGVLEGVLLSATISSRRAGILRDSAPIAVLAVVAVSYVSLDFAGDSGYLGAFLAGLIVGNMELLGLVMHTHNEDELRTSSRTLSEVVTIFVFLVVGAALPFATLADNWAPSLAVVAVLLLVARPVAVLACTLPDRRALDPRGAGVPVLDAREAWCRPRWSACSRAWGCRTSTCWRGSSRWRSWRRCFCRPRPRRGSRTASGCSSRRLPLPVDRFDPAGVGVHAHGGQLGVVVGPVSGDGERDGPERAPVQALADEPNLRALRREPGLRARHRDRALLREADLGLLAALRREDRHPEQHEERQHAAPGQPGRPLRRFLRRRVDAYA